MVISAAIIVFVRLPVPGQVKTRLAAGVGPTAACHFYKLCAEHILQTCTKLGHECSVIVQHSCNDSTHEVQQWLKGLQLQASVVVLPQLPDPDLGVKMQHAMAEQLQQPGINKVLIVGSDIPDLDEDVLRAALKSLDTYEALGGKWATSVVFPSWPSRPAAALAFCMQVVLGPAADGGYYLMGLRRMILQLFQDMPWSTPAVLQRTMEAAAASAAHVCPAVTLPTLKDIDTLSDLTSWYHSAQQGMQVAQQGTQVAQQGMQVAEQGMQVAQQGQPAFEQASQQGNEGYTCGSDERQGLERHGIATQVMGTCLHDDANQQAGPLSGQASMSAKGTACACEHAPVAVSRRLLLDYVSQLLQQTS